MATDKTKVAGHEGLIEYMRSAGAGPEAINVTIRTIVTLARAQGVEVASLEQSFIDQHFKDQKSYLRKQLAHERTERTCDLARGMDSLFGDDVEKQMPDIVAAPQPAPRFPVDEIRRAKPAKTLIYSSELPLLPFFVDLTGNLR